MKVTITLDYWDARHLLDYARRAPKATIRERVALNSLYDKLERFQHRLKKAAEDDEEFGGMHFPEDVRRIMQDDLSEPLD